MAKRKCVRGHVTTNDKDLFCSQCGAALPPVPRSGCLLIGGAFLGTLFVGGIVIIIGIALSTVGGNERAAATPSPAASVKMPAPTRVALPTVTLVPTVTKSWAASIAAVATPTPQPVEATDEQRAYLVEVSEVLDATHTALSLLIDQTSAVVNNPMVLYDEEWRRTTNLWLYAILVQSERLRALHPPSGYEGAQADLVTVAEYLEAAAFSYAEGVDKLDSDKIDASGVNLTLAVDALLQAVSKISGEWYGSTAREAKVTKGANPRSGPGTNYEKTGSAAAGSIVDVVGQNSAGDWLKLANGSWIAEYLVEGTPDNLPIVPLPSAQ